MGKRKCDFPQGVGLNAKIDGGAFEGVVAQKIPDGLDANTLIEKTHREGMTKAIGARSFQRKSASPGSFVVDGADGRTRDRPLRRSAPKKKFLPGTPQTSLRQISLQEPDGLGVQGQDESGPGLALVNPQGLPLQVEIVQLQGDRF